MENDERECTIQGKYMMMMKKGEKRGGGKNSTRGFAIIRGDLNEVEEFSLRIQGE